MSSENLPGKRILLLVITIAAAVLTGFAAAGRRPDYAVIPAIISLLSAVGLLRHIAQTEKNLNLFFDSVNSNDSSVTFSGHRASPGTRKLYQQLNRVNQTIAALRVKAEAREHYYRSVIRQSATGLIVIGQNGEIELINDAAAQFAGISPASTDTRLFRIRNRSFYDKICNLQPGKTLSLSPAESEPGKSLLLQAKEIVTDDRNLKLVTIENIRQALDNKELESYQSLIRILTHEIMNAVAPLTSVSHTLHKLFLPDGRPLSPGQVSTGVIEATVKGLMTIEEQGKGMLNFVNSYRQLTRLPRPVIESFNTSDWITQLHILLNEQLSEENISLAILRRGPVESITADKNLINQVILNLVNNARDALKEISDNRKLIISLIRREPSLLHITVANNGPQIAPENIGKIFVPFFTTKPNGSGIGLPLCRQIIYLHNGLLSVTSGPEKTTFILELPS